ncbi:hypothetical protein AB8989_08085 [Yersinia hibernica]|uniref:Uncharacterized protein n=1 Tax=Yersinia hibernica TaxID=2339259 RepID=A0ABX5R5L4_9GAMM|nr:hypothetical protein [Yersinia hibernica]QAX80919.1 hypothetical protein D5F51_21785 [Yersinia hibernica]
MLAGDEKSDNEKNLEMERMKITVDIWKTVIDTQKHFNDLEMKVRNFGILVLSAFIGAIGVSFNSGYFFSIYGINAPVAFILSFGATIIWFLIYFVDVYWYHPLLLGAVKHGASIEKGLIDIMPEIGLTTRIGKESPTQIFWKKDVHSTTKAKLFYFGVLIVLIISTTLLFFADKPGKKETSDISLDCNRHESYDGYKCTISNIHSLHIGDK